MGALPSSRSSRVCLDSRCPEHLLTNCPPRTRAVGPSQGGGGGEGQLGRETLVTHKILSYVDKNFPFPVVQTENVGQASCVGGGPFLLNEHSWS